ncbi:MAG: hypothetical protein ACI9SC_000007 [Gammaproteobacteria bacterium]|jgi:hypothetical protein
MVKKFTEGLVFGAGLGISFVAICFLSFYYIYPVMIVNKSNCDHDLVSDSKQTTDSSIALGATRSKGEDIEFHELDLDGQIIASNAIALAG